ncbi:MAG: alpha-galactosidase [Clostridiales bacterium]|nr:alpha-galactosidase [Clostridiales bacterium]
MTASIQNTERNNTLRILNKIAEGIGCSISDISFRIYLKEHNIILSPDDFNLVPDLNDESVKFEGSWRDINIIWDFKKSKGGYTVSLKAYSDNQLNCTAFDSLIVRYKPETGNIMDWRVLQYSDRYVTNPIGFPTVKEALEIDTPCNMLTGTFRNNKEKGLFLGTVLPQDNRHLYKMQMLESGQLQFTCTTRFITTVCTDNSLSSEITWISACKNVKESFDAYADFVPFLPDDPKPVRGWNSWDYYYFSVSLDALIENMEAIRKDDILSKNIQYIVIDDGWQHMYGEWEPNYKFPGGLERAVKEIKVRGFIPGIWLAPLFIDTASYAGLRMPELMVKNEYGDPLIYDGNYILDPTSPAGKKFLKGIYTKLYEMGFRYFKVDHVRCLLNVDRFYEKHKGPYEVLRDLFALIRECVTEESYILGCSLPLECGPGLSDAGRTGIDIHNQWNHLEWALECYTFKYWANKRVWVNDIDFLIVRGKDTSLEEETNVLNPNENNPNAPRWRRGEVFDKYEAQTWTNIVMFTRGNVFLSDRINMLNEEGKKLIRKGIQSTETTAEPLDMCCGYHPSLWLQRLNSGYRLTVINWQDEKAVYSFDFEEYRLTAPDKVVNDWTGEEIGIQNGRLNIELNSHESIVFIWDKF